MKHKNHLRKVREERMMSKSELARKAGISVLTVGRIERGSACRYVTKRKLLAALEIAIQDRALVFPDPPDTEESS
ncbi:MAG: helix-turn-helix domain-containing protein [Myxococcota bacterium]